MKVNLEGVESWKSGGGILPPGKHNVVIADVDEGVSRNGHPQLELRLESLDPSAAGAGIRDWIVVTANTLGRVRQLLEAVGIEIPDGEFDLPVAKLFDKRVTIYVVEEPKQSGDGTRTTVSSYSKLEESDLPADTAGLPVGASAGNGAGARNQADLPF